MKRQVIIFGAGGHAESVADVIAAEGKVAVAGLIDSIKPVGSIVFGHKILGREAELLYIVKQMNIKDGIVAVGDNFQRKAFMDRIKKKVPDFTFIVSIHPSAAISKGAFIGAGTVVMAMAAVNHGSRVGEGCIINTKASLDHNSVMEDFSSLAPGVTCGGQVYVGFCSAVGIGTNIVEKIRIGGNSVIGAGALVNRDIKDNAVAYGVPAKIVRNRHLDEPYLR